MFDALRTLPDLVASIRELSAQVRRVADRLPSSPADTPADVAQQPAFVGFPRSDQEIAAAELQSEGRYVINGGDGTDDERWSTAQIQALESEFRRQRLSEGPEQESESKSEGPTDGSPVR